MIAGEGTVTIPGYSAFGSRVYLAGDKISIPGYAPNTSDLYSAGTKMTIPGYTAFGNDVYLAGSSVTVPAYSEVTTKLYKAGSSVTKIGDEPNVTLYKRDTDLDTSYNPVGTSHSSGRYHEDSSTQVTTRGSKSTVTLQGNTASSTLYLSSTQGTYGKYVKSSATYYVKGSSASTYSSGGSVYKEAAALQAIPYNGTLYEKGTSGTIPGYVAFGSKVYLAGNTATALGDQYSSTLYTRDSANDKGYTVIGSKPNVTLYKRDTDNDQVFTALGDKITSSLYWRDTDQDREYTTIGKEPDVILYKRDVDLDREIPTAGETCRLKLASVSTKEVTVLTN